MKIKKILAADDFSEGAVAGLKAASTWASRLGAELTVLYVMPPPVPSASLFPELVTNIVAEIPILLERADLALRRRVREVTGRKEDEFRALVGEGAPHVGILEEAAGGGADLIVIGSLGHTAASEFLLGSVAEQVVRGAQLPVLVARPSPSSARIVAAVDFSDGTVPIVDAAAELALSLGQQLTLLHALHLTEPFSRLGMLAGGPVPTVTEANRQAMHRMTEERLRMLVPKGRPPAELRVVDGQPAAEILRAAKELKAELVVVGPIERKGFARLLLGSVASRVLRAAPCSVLVARPSTTGK